MNIEDKYSELTKLLSDYLDEKISHEQISNFAWDVIDFFSNTPSRYLPPSKDLERDFWYAIWEIQHLAESDHIENKAIRQELINCLSFLKNERQLPASYIGKRPKIK